MRKPIFETIRTVRGKPFSTQDVTAVDALCDTLGIARDEAPAADDDGDDGDTSPLQQTGLDDPAAFYSNLRSSGLFNKITEDQVEGLAAVLKAAGDAGWPISFAAYALATAYHETAHTMQPVREAFWKSEDWRKRNFRYYPYYGRGYVQLTWKANYERADKELNLGGKLLQNLDLAMDPDIASRVMVKGMQEGWFCGDKAGVRHALKRHLSTTGVSTLAQYTEARRIINGTDKAAKIAGEAMKFQAALKAGGW
jgi:hypothetical protein